MDNTKDSSSKFKTALLDSLRAHVAIVDQQGTIVESNESWKSFSYDSALIKRAEQGENYFEVLQHAIELGDDYALKILLGLKQVLNHDKSSYSITYPLKIETNAFWFNLTIRPCNSDKSQFIMIHEDITPSMKAKYEKQENEDRFQVKFEQSPDGIFITDSNGDILEANQAASNILGWSQGELVELSLDSVINVEDPKYKAAVKQQKKSGTYALELDFIDKQGNIIPTETTSRTYRNPDGKLRSIISFHDISRRKEIEQDLIKTKNFADSALESIPGAFFVLNSKGKFVRWNKNMVTRLGYTEEELSNKDILDFVVEDYRETAIEHFENCLNGEELSVEIKVYNKKGEIRDYFIRANRFVEEGKTFIAGAALDRTEEKQIEREHRRNQLMLEQLFDNSPVGITIVDNENQIRRINSSFENIFGYSKDEVTGKNINKLLAPKGKASEAEAISVATQSGESLQTETIRINKKGEEIPVLIGSVPVKLHDEIIAIYGMYVDVSTQHNYREKLKAALREKEALLSELHHRVKNNLALVNSLVELQLFDADNPKLKGELQNIKNRIMTIASIHEVLYQNGSLTHIPFENFIDELISTGMIQNPGNKNNILINTDSNKLDLTINQSIPAGLLINELLALIFSFTDKEQSATINIRLRTYGEKAHIIIEGNNIVQCPNEVKKQQSLHHTLIETLVMQLNGTVIWPNSDTEYQKFEFFFTKEHSTSPASDFLTKAE